MGGNISKVSKKPKVVYCPVVNVVPMCFRQRREVLSDIHRRNICAKSQVPRIAVDGKRYSPN